MYDATTTYSRKVLWKNQGIEDNHTDDDTFLKELRTNVNLRTYTFWEAVRGSAVLIQQISLVVLFLLIFVLLYHKITTDVHIICLCSVSLLLLHSYYRSLTASQLLPSRNDLRTFVVIYGSAFEVSPILSTLTRTVSTDSIYSMVAGLLFANLVVHDYGPQAMVVSQAFSLNAAFGAAVCLASRLPSPMDAFALVICAVSIFGLWPAMRSVVKERMPRAFLCVTLGMVGMNVVLLGFLSWFWLVMYVTVVSLVGLGCPGLLMWMQPWKTTIHGPWDEAVLRQQSES